MADSPSLAGRVAVVVGDDAARVGETVRVLADAGARAAGFVGDPAADAAGLTEMVAELFPEQAPERVPDRSPESSGDAPEPA